MRASLSLALIAVVSLSFGACSSTSRVASDIYHSLPFTGSQPEAAKPEVPREGEQVVKAGSIVFRMQVTPLKVKLSDTRHLDVKIRLENTSKKFTQLSFPTTQRIELLVRSDDGKVITQWSEDRAFDPQPGYVSINPGEFVEYATTLSTRDLQAGRTYTVLGFFPNYDAFRAEQVITPEP